MLKYTSCSCEHDNEISQKGYLVFGNNDVCIYTCTQNISSSMTNDYAAQVPTTVFTPLELAAIGLTEERAAGYYGKNAVQVSYTTQDKHCMQPQTTLGLIGRSQDTPPANLLIFAIQSLCLCLVCCVEGNYICQVYHAFYHPLEFYLPAKETGSCYVKMVCVGTEERVVGLHMTGPNAGEMMQGFAVALKYGCNRVDIMSRGIAVIVVEEAAAFSLLAQMEF